MKSPVRLFVASGGFSLARPAALLLLAASGCDSLEKFDVDVEENTDGAPEISWQIGKVHYVEVRTCGGEDCVCDRNTMSLTNSVDRVWQVGATIDILEDVGATEPLIESPLFYGQEGVPGDLLQEVAEPLEAGIGYGVHVELFEPCDPPASSVCTHTEARGCSTFEL